MPDEEIPTGRPGEGDLPEDGAQSRGSGTTRPPSVVLRIEEKGGGAYVDDISFIPAFRADPTVLGSFPGCAELRRARDALLAGRPQLAGRLREPPGGAPADSGHCMLQPSAIADVARLELGQTVAGGTFDPSSDTASGTAVDQASDARQNLWRWAGDLPRAEAAARAWMTAAGPAAPLPLRRLAEIHFLGGRYDAAAGAFGSAARLARAGRWDAVAVDECRLGRGVSLLRAGRYDEGVAQLRALAEEASTTHAALDQDESYEARDFAVVAYHAYAQLADAERAAGAARAALDDYAAARFLVPGIVHDDTLGVQPSRLDGNAALAHLAIGDPAGARAVIERAVAADPWNPAYLMTAGYAATLAGDDTAAVRLDTAALASDPGAYPAANDLGVTLLRLGRREEAVEALRRAVGARPSYALGWFNLAVAQPFSLASQGAYARAYALDPGLRDRPREPTVDTGIYPTGLDL